MGLTCYPHAYPLLQQEDEVQTPLRKGNRAPAGHLRVDVPVAMGRLIFAQEMLGFLERDPNVTLERGCAHRAVRAEQDGRTVIRSAATSRARPAPGDVGALLLGGPVEDAVATGGMRVGLQHLGLGVAQG